jgi:hypothetical protein
MGQAITTPAAPKCQTKAPTKTVEQRYTAVLEAAEKKLDPSNTSNLQRVNLSPDINNNGKADILLLGRRPEDNSSFLYLSDDVATERILKLNFNNKKQFQANPPYGNTNKKPSAEELVRLERALGIFTEKL